MHRLACSQPQHRNEDWKLSGALAVLPTLPSHGPQPAPGSDSSFPAADLHLARVATAIALEGSQGLHKAPFSDPLALVLSLLSHRLTHTREKLDGDSRPSAPDSHPQPKWQRPPNQGEAVVHFGHKGALWTRAPSPPALTQP